MKRFASPSDIRVAVIGYGASFNMGRHHMNAARNAGLTPVAVADIDPERLPAAQTDFPGIQTFPSVDALLEGADFDLAVVVTPHDTHAELAIRCLEAGKHVVTEKPFAITTAECDAMIAAAQKHDCMLSVHHNRHWDGCILKALENLRAGMIGDVCRVECHMGKFGPPRAWWRDSKRISGGINYDWGAHFLEYALQIIDAGMVEVAGFARNGFWAPQSPWGDDAIEDESLTIVRFDNGVSLSMLMTRLESNPRPGWFDITGTRGSYRFDHQGWEAVIQENPGIQYRRGPNPGSEAHRFYENIAAHLTRGEALAIPPEWARRTIHILDLSDQSARTGRSLPVRYR